MPAALSRGETCQAWLSVSTRSRISNLGALFRDLRTLCLVTVLTPCCLAGAQSPAVNYSPPMHIIKGGTYSGNWESQDPSVPAVLISTTAPVAIENCIIRSKSDLITTDVSNAHVTIRNCRGYGLDSGVVGQHRGDFFFGFQLGSLTVEHNYIEGTYQGVYIIGTVGWSLDGPLMIRYNQAKNLDGAPSDGMGGRLVTNQMSENTVFQFSQYNNIQQAEIAWNEIQSDPSISWIADTIDIWSSSGTPSTPIEVHDNYIQGGYPFVPTATLYYAGGITMDGSATNTAATATAYVKIHDNQIVAHSNFGIGLAAGHDNEAYSNRVVSSGQFADGAWYVGYAGIYVIDCACYQQPPSVYFNNSAHDNVVGFRFENVQGGAFVPPPVRQDYLLPDCAGGANGVSSKCVNNSSLPDPISSATELHEYVLWQQKLSANGIVVGPQTTTDDNYQGLWWAAPAGSESGWGINFAHQGDVIFATWFTYDTTGKAWWLAMVANKTATGVYGGTIFTTHGPAFNAVPFNPALVTETTVGSGTLDFTDANDAQFAYTVNGVTQTKTLVRELFGSALPVCSFGGTLPAAQATNYQDLWWASPAGSESGWGVNLTQQGDVIFATWFTYDASGNPLWLSGPATKAGPRVYTGTLAHTSGPAFNAVPFDPERVTETPVGGYTLTFSDGANGTFAYTVNGVSQVKAITREVFVAPGTVCH